MHPDNIRKYLIESFDNIKNDQQSKKNIKKLQQFLDTYNEDITKYVECNYKIN